METLLLPQKGDAAASSSRAQRSSEASGGCFSGCFRGCADAFRAISDPGPPGEEPAYLRLQRMHEESERREAEEKAAEEERKKRNEDSVKEWNIEMSTLLQRRDGLEGEALDRDCDAYCEFFQVLGKENFDELFSFADASPSAQVSPAAAAAEDDSCTQEETPAVPRIPDGPLEQWFITRFGGSDQASSRAAASFGELDTCDASLAASFVEALRAGAEVDERLCQEAEGMQPKEEIEVDFASKLDQLIEKYNNGCETPRVSGDAADAAEPEAVRRPAGPTVNVPALRARAARRRGVAGRIEALQPLLEGDQATVRLVAALAALEAGRVEDASGGSASTSDRTPAEEDALAALRALSTADVCWGAASEKRQIVFDRMLPSAGADGSGGVWASWEELRPAAPGWWLSSRELDTMVTKLAQVSLQRLRRAIAVNDTQMDGIDSGSQRLLRKLADEAFFWYVAGRAGLDTPQAILTKLRALLKTGALRGEPALETLLNHGRSDEPDFMRKNAFRLLQLQRFYLSAALFVIGGSLEEAANVAARRLNDMQLALVLARRESRVVGQLLQDFRESTQALYDPWLHLLSWQAPVYRGDLGARSSQDGAVKETHHLSAAVEEPPRRADGILRVVTTSVSASASSSRALREVTRLLAA